MGSNWPLVKIEDIQADKKGAIAIGPFGSRMKSDSYVEIGIPVIRGTNLSESPTFKNEFVFISEDKANSLGSCNVYQDDLVFPHRGSIGEVGIVTDDRRYVISSSLMKLTCDQSKVNPEFLYYFFKSLKGRHELLKNASQVGTPGIGQPLTSLKSIQFRSPPLVVQDKIVLHIKGINDKIELNRQTNQTLEKMAQTLFKSWFVDFDPVFDNLLAKADFKLENLASDFPDTLHHKAQLRLTALQGQASAKNCELAALFSEKAAESENNTHSYFPCEFEFNEQLGWIPKGWGVKAVSKAIQVNPRTTLPKGTMAKFADMKAIPTSGYMVDEVIEKAFSGGAKFKSNDVLLARITPCLQNGKTALVDFLGDDEVGFGSTEFIVFRGTENISYPFIACLARDEKFRNHCMQSMVGSSGRQRVQNACFDDYYLATPNKQNLVDMFSEITAPYFTKMTNNKLENQSLTELRDTLLPKLISGELQIPDVDISE